MSAPFTSREVNGFLIESGVPIPRKGGNKFERTGLMKVLQELQVGDSVVLEEKRRANAGTAADRLGIKVLTRKVEEGKIRLWRIE